MTRVLIVHASRHGATAGIADRIGSVMRDLGFDATVVAATNAPSPAPFDACVVGAGVYMGSWVKAGTEFLDRYAGALATRPVWLFSSGPLPGSSKEPKGGAVDPIENALGPLTGPGSGGRKRIEELVARIHPRDHRVFMGAFDPTAPPASFPERVVRWMPAGKSILPAGDFREWPAIEAWAREITGALQPAGAVAQA